MVSAALARYRWGPAGGSSTASISSVRGRLGPSARTDCRPRSAKVSKPVSSPLDMCLRQDVKAARTKVKRPRFSSPQRFHAISLSIWLSNALEEDDLLSKGVTGPVGHVVHGAEHQHLLTRQGSDDLTTAPHVPLEKLEKLDLPRAGHSRRATDPAAD